MENKYKNPYADDTMYGNVVSLVENLNLKNDGIHLDIACGFSAVDEGLKKHNYNFEYVGIDANEDFINVLKQNGLEAYQYSFTCEEQDFDFIDKILKGRDLRKGNRLSRFRDVLGNGKSKGCFANLWPGCENYQASS